VDFERMECPKCGERFKPEAAGLLRSLSSFSLWVRVTITLANVSPVAIVIAGQPVHYKGVGPYPANQFIDVLAKVGYVRDATSILQPRISQVFS
jgi:hypothetical protein